MKKINRWISLFLVAVLFFNLCQAPVATLAAENLASVDGEEAAVSGDAAAASSEEIAVESEEVTVEDTSENDFAKGSEENVPENDITEDTDSEDNTIEVPASNSAVYEASEGANEEPAETGQTGEEETQSENEETDANEEDGQSINHADNGNTDENADAEGNIGNTDSEETADAEGNAKDAEKTAETGESAEDSEVDGVKIVTDEVQVPEQEELVKRKLYASPERVSAWEPVEDKYDDEEPQFTDQMLWAESLWQWMYKRDAEPEAEDEIKERKEPSELDGTILLEDDTPLVVEIDGMLPEGVEAVARYVDFAPSEDARSERALFAVDITFYYTETGAVYVPENMEMLTITLKGETVSTILREKKPLLVYANAQEDRPQEVLDGLESGYVSSVRVFTSGQNIDPDRLGYKAGMDGDRFYFVEDGEELLAWEETDEEPEKITFKTYALNTQMAPLRFVFSAQQTEHTATAESGKAEVSVTGIISEKVAVDAADADTEAAPVDSENEVVVDVDVNVHHEDVEEYVPDTSLTYKVESAAIGEAVEKGEEVKVWVAEEGADSVEVEEAVIEGNTVQFTSEAAASRITVTTVKAESTVLASDGNQYRVTVEYDASSGLPDDAVLDVVEIPTDSEEYAQYVGASAEKIGQDAEKVGYARAFDISIVDKETGEKYQPTKDVKVSIELLDEEVKEDAELSVVHFAGSSYTEDEAKKSENTSVDKEKLGEEAEVVESTVVDGAVQFESGSFSVYVVLQATLERIIEASDGNTYKITMVYDSNSGLPMDAELEVVEIPADSDEYEQFINASAGKIGQDAQYFGLARAFDITIVDSQTGERYQPNKNVKVSVELMDEEVGEDSDVSVVHFPGSAYTENLSAGDDAPALNAEELSESAEVIDSAVVNGAVEFQSDSFSVYVVIMHEGAPQVVTPRVEFHFIDEEFHYNNELAYSSLTNGQYQAAPYSFLNKGGTYQTTQILKDGESLEMVKNPENVVAYELTTDTEIDTGKTYYTFNSSTGKYTEVSSPELANIGSYYEKYEKYFFGWYVVDGSINQNNSIGSIGDIIYTWPEDPKQIRFEKALSITKTDPVSVEDFIKWEVDGVTGTAALDSEATAHVYLAPVYEDYYFVNFHLGTKDDDQLKDSLLARKIVVLGSDEQVKVRIGNVEAPSTNATRFVFAGWETLTDGGVRDIYYNTIDTEGDERDFTKGSDGNETAGAAGSGYHAIFGKTAFSSDRNIHLYPVFNEARWIYFNTGKSGNGASYVGARYRITNDDNTGTYYTTFPTSTRSGFDFDGWYVDAVVDSNGEITNIDTPAEVTITYIDDAGDTQTVTQSRRQAHKLVNADGTLADTNYQNTVTNGGTEYKRFAVEEGQFYVYKGMEKVTLYAKWTPKEVNYTVVYWLENANDENYTLVSYDTFQAIAGDTVKFTTSGDNGRIISIDASTGTEYDRIVTLQNSNESGNYYIKEIRYLHYKTYDGMDGDTNKGVEIAGDDSTVINIYYDRNVYTVRFDIGFATRTNTSGSTQTYAVMTSEEAAAYDGTVYGAINGAYVALIKDINGKWIYADDTNGLPYGVVSGNYVPLKATIETSTQLYKPQYRYTASTSDATDGLYGIDSDGNYIELEGTETTVPGNTYYILTSTITSGNEYLIVSSNSAGNNRYALGHSNNNNISANQVSIRSGISDTGGKVYIDPNNVDDTSVWTAGGGSESWTFSYSGSYYLQKASSGNSLAIGNNSSSTGRHLWTWNNDYLTNNNNNRYLCYNNNSFTLDKNAYSVYLYEKTDTTSTTWSYKIKGTDMAYDGARYIRSKNNSSVTYYAADLTEHNNVLSYYDTNGDYGAANMYIPVVEAGMEYTYSYSYNGVNYTDAIYKMAVYGGTLYTQTSISGTWTFSVSNITGPNYSDNDNWVYWLTNNSRRYDLGNSNPFSPGDYNGTYEKTENGTNYIIYYYDITAKYGEKIMDEYPGSQSVKRNGNSSYSFVGWLSQRDSYYNRRLNTSLKGFQETMSEDLILTGGTIPGYNSKDENVSTNGYYAVSVDNPDHTNNTVTGEYGITQEFRCRYTTLDSAKKYLYRIYLADPETREYPTEPTDKFVITAGSGSNPDIQTPPSYYGYTLVKPRTRVLRSLTDTVGEAPTGGNYREYAIPELTAAGVGSGMIIEFFLQPNAHTITFMDSQNSELGNATYYYGQSLEDADEYSEAAEAATPTGHVFAGWYENNKGVGNVFNFNTTMPDGSIILYATYSPIRYRIKIDPNGGEIDHVNHEYDNSSSDESKRGYTGYWWDANGNIVTYASGKGVTPFATFNRGVIYASDHTTIEREADSGYNRNDSTVVNLAYGKVLDEYSLECNYVPLSDAAAEEYVSSGGTVYYYVNVQYNTDLDGTGPASDLRNALYMTEDELHQYYLFYHDWTQGNIEGGFIENTTLLGEAAWRSLYVSEQKYRRAFAGEHYEFLGWYQVYDDDSVSNMPYNFNTPISKPISIRAKWRLDAGYQIVYTPEYKMSDGTVINGKMYMNTWTDPAITGAKYADGANTQILQQPTGLTANGISTDDYIFRGWRLISADGVPLEDGVYYDPGDQFTIAAAYADRSGFIHIQAVYEEKDNSYRRPHITNLKLDANTGYISLDGKNELTENVSLTSEAGWDGIGTVAATVTTDSGDAELIEFGDIQTEEAVHLYRFATTLTTKGGVTGGDPLNPAGKNYFVHRNGDFLLGFDDAANEGDYVATYPADSVISVTRNDNRTLYAVWEPMVYLTFKNETKVGDVTFSLSSSTSETLEIINTKNGMYDRTPLNSAGSITVHNGESVTFAFPKGAEKNIIVSGTNTLGVGKALVWNSSVDLVENGKTTTKSTVDSGKNVDYDHVTDEGLHRHTLVTGKANNTASFYFTEDLIVNENAVTVTFTHVDNDYALVMLDNYNGDGTGGGTQEIDFPKTEVKAEFEPVGTKTYTFSSGTSTRIGYQFVGWATEASSTAADYSATSPSGSPWKITDLEAFFSTAEEVDGVFVRYLYGVWEAKTDAVYVYKEVPEPGNQNQGFDFTVSITGKYYYGTGGANWEDINASGSFKLRHGWYLKIKSANRNATDYSAGNRDTAFVQAVVQVYNASDEQQGSKTIRWEQTGVGVESTNHFSDLTIKVTEANNSYYDTKVKRNSVSSGSDIYLGTDPDGTSTPYTVSTNYIHWSNTDAGGTFVFVNDRKTCDITIAKTLVSNVSTSAIFNYKGSYVETYTDINGVTQTKTVNLDDFTVTSGSSKSLDKIPLGVKLTVTEYGINLIDYAVTAAHSSPSGSMTVIEGSYTEADETIYTRAVSIDSVSANDTITFTNSLKYYPITIYKLDQGGNAGVETFFKLDSDTGTIRQQMYPNSTTGLFYNENKFYVGEYTLTETFTQDGYEGLTGPVTLKVSGEDGGKVTAVTANGDEAKVTVEGNASTGFVVKVYNIKTIDISINKVLIDPILGSGRTFYFRYAYSYTLNNTTISVDKKDDDAIAIASGSGSAIKVPVIATNLTIAEETSRKGSSNSSTTIADTYDTYYEITNGSNTVVANTAGNSHTYSTLSESNNGDKITFTNKAKTVSVTVKKTVSAADKDGTFRFVATLGHGSETISEYAIFINGTSANEGDDEKTDSSGQYSFDLSDGGTKVLTVPVGATLTIKEASMEASMTHTDSTITLDNYTTTATASLTTDGIMPYTGNTSYDEETRLFTLPAAPGNDLTITFTNGDGGVDIKFKKIDGFGNILDGAVFSLYTNQNCAETDVLKVSGVPVSATSTSGIVTIEKVPNGVFYMKEITVPERYTNDNTYLVLVGESALNEFATYGLAQADITGQTAKYKATYGDTYDKYAIFLIDTTSDPTSATYGKAVSTPDIATYGIMNISTVQPKVILRKVNKAYESLQGATFDILCYDQTVHTIKKTVDGQEQFIPASDQTSGTAGCIWIGNLPFGTYYIHEKAAPTNYSDNAGKWFCVIVDENGTWMSKAGYDGKTDIANRASAYSDANALRPAGSTP